MQKTLALLGLVIGLVGGCGEKPADNTGGATNAPAATNAQNAPGGYLGALGRGQQSAIKTLDTASLNKAVEMFNLEHGRNPKDLNELVQKKFIPEIPSAPYGSKLVYDAASGTVSVQKQ